MKVFVAITRFFGVSEKSCGLKSGPKLKLRTEPEIAVSRISYIQDLQKLLTDYNFQSD